jgi:hypothetical protein
VTTDGFEPLFFIQTLILHKINLFQLLAHCHKK